MIGYKNRLRRVLKSILRPISGILHEVHEEFDQLENERKKEVLSSQFAVFGSQSRLNGKIRITHPRRFSIGRNVHIGDNAYFFCLGGLFIGDNTHISRNVTIYTANHDYNQALPYGPNHLLRPVSIDRNVWIGMGVSISPGVHIGEGAIIGIGTTVTKDVPAKQIIKADGTTSERQTEQYRLILETGLYGGINGRIIQNLNHEVVREFCFVLGTGRSGTTAFVDTFRKNTNVHAVHECHEGLVQLSTDFLYGRVREERVKEILKVLYVSTSQSNQEIFLEANQKLAPFIGILSEILPSAKFIHLQREPKACIKSMYDRGWYTIESSETNSYDSTIDKWDAARLLGGILDSNIPWDAMSRLEKCIWYYVYYNYLIESSLSMIDNSRFRKYSLEEISMNTLDAQEFIGVDLPSMHLEHSNKKRKQDEISLTWNSECDLLLRKWMNYYGS